MFLRMDLLCERAINFCPGKQPFVGRGIYRYSTAAAALEEPIKPPVSVQYDKLLINGQFVDAASGDFYYVMEATSHLIGCLS